MLIVRCTAKLLSRLHADPASAPPPSTTRLGDWYATILPVRPEHAILLVNEPTRLAVVLPARQISTLAQRIPDAIARVLLDLDVDAGVIEEERRAMAGIVFARTISRSVLGTMNVFIQHWEAMGGRNAHLGWHEQSMELGRILVSPLGYRRPAEVAKEMLVGGGGEAPRLGANSRRVATMKTTSRIYELKVTLAGTRPPIWRRLRVKSDITLFKLHGILQRVMGWMDGHLHQFVARDTTYGELDPELPGPRENERKARLSEVLRKPKDRLMYEYDFGDGWRHLVVLEQVLEAEEGARYPYVVAGKRACPPEDSGGVGGYARLLEVLANPRHPEHRDLVEWVGGTFDPEAFDRDEINRSFHGGWYLPKPDDAPRSKTALPRQTVFKLVAKARRG